MTVITKNNLRNIAIIAHVDHGKTTLLDHMFRQSGMFRTGQSVEDRIMDSMDLERERGITISAKNCSVTYEDVKINVLDTPGHADFGSEVERALKMVDGVILLVDSSEGPLPQTRFVLGKALEQNHKIIVVINKIDRPDARIAEVLDEVYDLFFDLEATEEQIEFPVLYAIGREGIAQKEPEGRGDDLRPLFDTILEVVPPPPGNEEEPFQLLVSDLSYSDYLGGLAIGRIANGRIRRSQELVCIQEGDAILSLRTTKLQVYEGLKLTEVDTVGAGEIAILAGVEKVQIGDTICTKEQPLALPRIAIDEPTVAMRFAANSSPFAGKEGKWVQSNKIRERLIKETLRNVGLQMEAGPNEESFLVKGRGELQLAILIETMRREGFELTVGRPEVLYRNIDGQRHEPIEHLYVDCEEEHVGVITEKLSKRKGRMVQMTPLGTSRVRMEFSIPSRGLIGYRSDFLTDTRGTGILSSYLEGFEPYRGDFPTRATGSLVSDRQGDAVPYAMGSLEARGRLIIPPNTPVYEGMIIGIHNRENDLNVNVCKTKKLTNMRASGRDDNVMLSPVIPITLEQAIEVIRDDEWVEVTPENIRLRKTVLTQSDRNVAYKQAKFAKN